MFTGIVEEIGTIQKIEAGKHIRQRIGVVQA